MLTGFENVSSTRDDVFSGRFNPPATSFKSWSLEYLTGTMNEWVRLETAAKFAELQAFLDMNERAIALWDKMVTCTGDEESARAAYAQGQFTCFDGNSGEAIRAALIELHGNFLDFIQTTDIHGTLEALRWVSHEPVIQMHPLLFQVVEETFTVWFPFGNTNGGIRKWLKRNLKDEATIEKSTRMINLIPLISFRSSAIGLWPTALSLSHAYTLAKFSQLQKSKAHTQAPVADWGLMSDNWDEDSTLFENAFLSIGMLFNPGWWIVKLVQLGSAAHESAKSIEPRLSDSQGLVMSDGLFRIADVDKSDDRLTYENARAATKRLRDIAARYGVKEKSLFR